MTTVSGTDRSKKFIGGKKMKGRFSRLKIALLASTAIVGLASLGAADDAIAACSNGTSYDNNVNLFGGTSNITSGSTKHNFGSGTINFNGTYSVSGECILYVRNITGLSTYNVNGNVTTDDSQGIKIDGALGYGININGSITVAPGGTAFVGGGGSEFFSVNDGGIVNGDVDGNGGLDTLTLNGATVINGNVSDFEVGIIDGNAAIIGTGTSNISVTTTLTDGSSLTIGGAGHDFSTASVIFLGDGTLQVNDGATMNVGGLVATGGEQQILVNEGTFNLNVAGTLLGGNDLVSVGGNGSPTAAFNAGLGLDFGDGDDTLRIFNGGTVSGLVFNFGAGNDTLEFTGDDAGGSTFSFASGLFIDDVVNINVPILGNINVPIAVNQIVKSGSGTWTLESPIITLAESLTVNEGTLNLSGNWVFTGNTITVNPNTTLNINPGVVVNLGDTNIGLDGTLNVLGGATVLTVGNTNLDGGNLTVNDGGIYTALSPITGSGENDTITVHGLLGAPSIDLGAGEDRITISGTLVTLGTVAMGDDDDTLEFQSNGGLILPLAFGGFDGGSGEDTVLLSGTVDYAAPAALAGPLFTDFEHLVKQGTNTWTLTSLVATTSFETLSVEEGTLNLIGFWEFTGSSTTVLANATLNIGPVAFVHEMGTLTVDGTVNVNAAALYQVDGLTTINAGGEANVNGFGGWIASDINVTGGVLNVNDNGALVSGNIDLSAGGVLNLNSFGVIVAGDVTVNAGSAANVQSLMFAQNTLITGAGAEMNVGPAGFYTSLGTTTVNAAGILRVGSAFYISDGAFTVDGPAGTTVNVTDFGVVWARSTTDVQGSGGTIALNGTAAQFYSAGAVTVQGSGGAINVFNGLFWAQDTTSVLGSGGTINVNGATAAFLSDGAVTVQGSGGTINVFEGLFTAFDTTTVQGSGGTINVNGANAFFLSFGAVSVQGSNGAINVFNGLFGAFDTTTVQGTGGTININGANAAYVSAGAVLVQGDGTINVFNGLFLAQDTTTVQGTTGAINVNGATAEYRATGAVVVQDTGDINVLLGAFNADDTTTLNGNGDILVNGGTYTSQGAVSVNGTADITVMSGTFFANSTTELNDAGVTLGVIGTGVYTAGDTITVNNGLVYGTGLIDGGQILDNQGGVVAPGTSIGTLFLVGTYNQASGGIFEAELQPGGPSDLLSITGSAALLGHVQFPTLASNFGLLEQYRIIKTDNPIPTIFETASVSGAGIGSNILWVGRVNDAGVFNINNPATGNNVDVILATAPGALQGLTPNQQAVADYIGQVAVPGGVYIEDAIVYLITQIVGAGPNALDQIGGEVYDSFTTFAFDTARQYGRLLDDRVRTLRCASIKGAPNAFCDKGMVLLADTGPDSVPVPGAQSPKGFSPNTHPYGWSVWASAIGSRISLDRTAEHVGYSGWTGGGVMGVDLALNSRWIVGVMVGGTKSDIDFSGVGGDGNLSNVGVGVYTAWYGRRWFANASFTYSKNWIEADRTLQFGSVDSVANGKTTGDQYAVHTTVGYGFVLGKTSLEVSGGLDWIQLRQDAFTETGAGLLNLSVNSRTDDSLRLRIGVRAAHPFVIRKGLMFIPSARVGYAREVLDNTRPITSSFGGIPGTFTVTGDEGSRNILTFGAGMKAEWSQGISLSVNYNGEWAGDRQGHGVSLSFRVRW